MKEKLAASVQFPFINFGFHQSHALKCSLARVWKPQKTLALSASSRGPKPERSQPSAPFSSLVSHMT